MKLMFVYCAKGCNHKNPILRFWVLSSFPLPPKIRGESKAVQKIFTPSCMQEML